MQKLRDFTIDIPSHTKNLNNKIIPILNNFLKMNYYFVDSF